VARILLEELNVIVVAISRTRTPELEDLSSKHSAQLLIFTCDVTNTTALQAAISTTVKTFKRLDGLVINAAQLGPLHPIASPHNDIKAWQEAFNVNLFSAVELCHLAHPYLLASKPGGKVVFVSSGAAVGNIAAWGAYNASKAALNSLCRTFANENPQITSVAIAPGLVDTAMQAALRSEGASTMAAAEFSRFTKAHSEGSLLNPNQCGYVIANLAVSAKKDLSGKFVRWDDEDCAPYRKGKEEA